MTIEALSASAFTPMIAPAGSSAPGTSTPPPTNPFSTLLDAATTAATAPASATANPYATPLPTSLYVGGASNPTGNAIAAEAERFLGVPYVWGGSSPAQGFDCSGLVQYVFSQLGVSLPRTSEQQAQVGTPVANLASAQPGDLLFFEPGQNGAPPGEPGHVAIYLGAGQMIAAPQTGQTVQIQQVPSVPFEIRRITVPANALTASLGGNAPLDAVNMGNVAVPSTYAGLITQASTQYGVPPQLLAATLQTESGFNPNAVSSAGAQGIAQFMPATAAGMGINPFDPTQAIGGAAALLGQYYQQFGSWPLAIAAYTAGAGAVEAAGGVPQDGTTPGYVNHVLGLAGGSMP